MTRFIAKLVSTSLLAIAGLFAPQATASQPPYEESVPFHPSGHAPYAARYYGTVSPYPLGYYPYPILSGYPVQRATYGLGYYPYAVPNYSYAAGYSPPVGVYYPYPRWGASYPFGFGFWPYGF